MLSFDVKSDVVARVMQIFFLLKEGKNIKQLIAIRSAINIRSPRIVALIKREISGSTDIKTRIIAGQNIAIL